MNTIVKATSPLHVVIVAAMTLLRTPVREMVKVSEFTGSVAMQIAKRSMYYLAIEADEATYGAGRYSAYKAAKDEPEHKAHSAARTELFNRINGVTTQPTLLALVQEMFPALV